MEMLVHVQKFEQVFAEDITSFKVKTDFKCKLKLSTL